MWWITFLLSFLFLLTFWIRISIRFHLFHGGDNDRVTIQMRAFWGILRYTIDIPFVKKEKGSVASFEFEEDVKSGKKEKTKKKKKRKITPEKIWNSLQDTKEVAKHVRHLHHIMSSFLKHIEVSALRWKTVIGVGDAAKTGTITGLLWTVKSCILGWVSHHMVMNSLPTYDITPDFYARRSVTEFECMIHFRVGHAILAALKLIAYWRGGVPKFKSSPLAEFTDKKESAS
ncbi:DUF2953 domain-containing protein [Bacillus fonticola]|uniref:DUF2953 domain-containing protein n=1 Tax=Bacillus fonticola TaxID=2728853 RepID=UPI001472C67B|nr:DUF2953 domain-containing protein [Bacillus fonticola]